MRTPKISVIVPVYKAEQYIHRCVDSLLAQTFQDFEVLLVDDGSPDRSGEICDEYAKKDSRVRVFHKENGGVSSARQCGMDNVRGEYMIHADPDDWVEPEMLEEMYGRMEKDNLDILIADYISYVQNNMRKYMCQKPEKCTGEDVLEEIIKGRLLGVLWNKMIRYSVCNKYNVHFVNSINYAEDVLFLSQLLTTNVVVGYVNRAYYYYDSTNTFSITRCYGRSTYVEQKKYIDFLAKILPSSRYGNSVKALMHRAKIRAFINMVLDKNEYYGNNVLTVSDILKSQCNVFYKLCLLMAWLNFWRLSQKMLYMLVLCKKIIYGCAL